MARRKRVYRKIERRDPRYDSALVGKLISKVMLDGKRSLAERIVYAAIDMANEGTDSIDPLEVITRAIENAKPRVEVKSRRVGGATYQVPLEVDPARSESLAMRCNSSSCARASCSKVCSDSLASCNCCRLRSRSACAFTSADSCL